MSVKDLRAEEAAARHPGIRRDGRPLLIGLYSSAPQMGKSTTAEYLARYGFHRVRFAGRLKQMIGGLLKDFGYSETLIDRMLEGDLKEQPIPQLEGRTTRDLLITLGTDWGRDRVDPALWVKAAMARVERIQAIGSPVVMEDLRFPNEAIAIINRGGFIVRVTGRTTTSTEGRAEGLLDGWGFGYTLENRGTKAEFGDRIDEMLAVLRRGDMCAD